MNKRYKLFRIYCILAIFILGALLFAVGLCTAKFQTDETVFKATYSTVRVFSAEDSMTLNFGGNILTFNPSDIIRIFEKARVVLLAPFNNFIELIKTLV